MSEFEIIVALKFETSEFKIIKSQKSEFASEFEMSEFEIIESEFVSKFEISEFEIIESEFVSEFEMSEFEIVKSSALHEYQSLEVNLNDNDLKNDNTNEINEAEQIIVFNLVIKLSFGLVLPSKWVEIKVSLLDDVLAEVHYYIGKIIDNKEIICSDYSITFKLEKTAEQEGNIIRELREKYKCKNHDACFVDNGRHLKLTAIHLQCWAKEIIHGSTDDIQMPNLPIFSQSHCVKKNSQTPTPTIPISFNSLNSNIMLPFFLFPFTQNSNNNLTLPLQALSSPTQPIPSLDNFFESLDNSEEFMQFKNTFK
ncbi:hypothetical protein C1645_838871, partial [Glomus cerebriforme]